MAAYLISRKNVEALDTVVFSAGSNDKEEAIALFTDPKSAEKYIEDAGWTAEYTVATVEPIPLLRWMLQAHDDGVQHIAVDPKYSSTRLASV